MLMPTSHKTKQGGQARLSFLGTGLALTLLLALVLAQSASAWIDWQRVATGPASALTPGAWCSVQLLNGQVYYGELASSNTTQVTLRNVYYVQPTVDPATNQPSGNRLVNRHKADWHAPTLTTVPADKILMIELVDPESRLAKLVAEDQGVGAKR